MIELNTNILDYEVFDKDEIFALLEKSVIAEGHKVFLANGSINDRPGLVWEIETHFYVVPVLPIDGSLQAWDLHTIDWDDNEGVWNKSHVASLKGVSCAEVATDFLMAGYLISCNLLEDETWREMLSPFCTRALRHPDCPNILLERVGPLFVA